MERLAHDYRLFNITSIYKPIAWFISHTLPICFLGPYVAVYSLDSLAPRFDDLRMKGSGLRPTAVSN
jgi:hypothetical protein